MSEDVTIVKIGREQIDDLKPLYQALHRHHAEMAPDLAGMAARHEDDSWASRRRKYKTWLAEPGAFALLARQGESRVGFALVSVTDGYDAWNSPPRIGEIRDIAVLPESRGSGVGSRLLEAVVAELSGTGINRYRLTVLTANTEAIRFYERHGLRPVSQQMITVSAHPSF